MDRHGGTWAVLGGLYRGAVDPAAWTHALDGLTRLFDGEMAVMEIRNRRRPQISIETSSVVLPPSVHKSYNSYYGLICPRAALLRSATPNVIMHDDHVGGEAALDRDEYYTDFLAPQGLRYFIACRVHLKDDVDVVLSVQRARAAGRVSAAAIDRFERIVPHIADAYALRLAFGAALGRAQAFDRVIDELGAAVVLLDRAGRPVHASRNAERLMAGALGIGLTREGFSVADAAARRALRAIFARCQSDQGGPGGVVAIPGASLALRVVPLDGESRHLDAARAPAIVVLIESVAEAADADLRRRLGESKLTQREAEIAILLAEGQSPREIAADQGLRLSTVRTHIARARTKLEARTIADLVRAVLKGRPH